MCLVVLGISLLIPDPWEKEVIEPVDTVRTTKPIQPFKVDSVDQTKPDRVIIHPKDTTVKPKFLGFRVTNSILEVQTLSPEFVPETKIYDIREFQSIQSDTSGNIQVKKKKKIWKKIWIGAGLIVGTTIAVIIHSKRK